MNETFEEIFDGMGAKMIDAMPSEESGYGLLNPGAIIHEVGTTRMGNNPKKSVTNKHQQLHDVDNVFIVDAGPFVSQADKNPTWTILALSWKTCDYTVSELKKQNI
jgi:choline dehydrogenase-like flavoprotein